MTSGQMRKLVVHAAEARGVNVFREEWEPEAQRAEFYCLTLDGCEVLIRVERCKKDPDSWIVSSPHGSWTAGDYPDCIAHATGEALGDKSEEEAA
jgi:hypothetical protein